MGGEMQRQTEHDLNQSYYFSPSPSSFPFSHLAAVPDIDDIERLRLGALHLVRALRLIPRPLPHIHQNRRPRCEYSVVRWAGLTLHALPRSPCVHASTSVKRMKQKEEEEEEGREKETRP